MYVTIHARLLNFEKRGFGLKGKAMGRKDNIWPYRKLLSQETVVTACIVLLMTVGPVGY